MLGARATFRPGIDRKRGWRGEAFEGRREEVLLVSVHPNSLGLGS
jgi:hypothetical protein